MSAPRGLVLNAPGINCQHETGFALEQAGGIADQVHISLLKSGDVVLDDYQILLLPGGFSHGDDIKSGRILGLEFKTRLAEDINRFVEAGKAVVGICNGFQDLVECGLLPSGSITGEPNRISLVNNANNNFEWRWNRLSIEDSVCRFIPDEMKGQIIELPSAHQEGRVEADDPAVLDDLADSGQVAFRFVGTDGTPTKTYPYNPNGTHGGITGITDPTGVVLGMMPHPERAVSVTHHPNWRRGEGQNPFGAILFKSLVEYAAQV